LVGVFGQKNENEKTGRRGGGEIFEGFENGALLQE
jgi:hypothetical protein